MWTNPLKVIGVTNRHFLNVSYKRPVRFRTLSKVSRTLEYSSLRADPMPLASIMPGVILLVLISVAESILHFNMVNLSTQVIMYSITAQFVINSSMLSWACMKCSVWIIVCNSAFLWTLVNIKSVGIWLWYLSFLFTLVSVLPTPDMKLQFEI